MDVHHTIEVAFFLVISMWGNTGQEWQYIGNKVLLKQAMTLEQCEYLINEDMWLAYYANPYYKIMIHCHPENGQLN